MEAVGDRYTLTFEGGDVVDGEIRDPVPGRRFAYSWGWRGAEPPEVTLVTWEVGNLGDGRSRITLIHGGWSEAGADAATRDDHAEYWESYVAALADYLHGRTAGA